MIKKIEELKRLGEISFDNKGYEKFMEYRGNIRDVLNILENSFQKKGLERDLDFFLYSNRLLIGIIDYGIATEKNVLRTKHNIESLCVHSFKGNYPLCYELLMKLEFTQSALNFEVVERKDNISWRAFDPFLIKKLIWKMKKKRFKPDYIVLDGHDAYRPGLMLASSLNRNICAIRNSQDSKRDKKPRILKRESEFLNYLFSKKTILVMGEDISTGRAVKSLCELIEGLSDPLKIVTASPIYIPGSTPLVKIDYYGEKRTTFF